ncbi:hypothetical protein [Limosilactobacillus reuteri]|uniref:hypothetical protein n=1 Tax=Limosilactobacillus reuteri TaxID=1598 RepID=UPI003D048F92
MAQTQTKTYSITEMANACGVSVSSMRSQLLKRGFKPAKTGENNSKLYNDKAFKTMRNYYRSKAKSSSNRQPQTTRSELIESKNAQIEQLKSEVELLKSQLNVKDEQIKAMTEVAKANAQLTAQAHTLDASHRLEDSSTTSQNESKTVSEEPHGLFWRIFH